MTNPITSMPGGTSPAGCGNDGSAGPSHACDFNDAVNRSAQPPASASNSSLTSLIDQLIPLLQQVLAKLTPNSSTAAQPPANQLDATPPNPPAAAAPPPAAPAAPPPANQLDATPPNPPATGQSQLISLLQELVSDLQGGTGSSAISSLIQQIIPLLQQQLGGTSPGNSKDLAATPSAGSGNDETALIQQLIAQLQAQGGQGGPATQPGTTPPANNPGAGISPAEINAMLAYSDGTGPAVNFSNYG
jgi:hypothetical protein